MKNTQLDLMSDRNRVSWYESLGAMCVLLTVLLLFARGTRANEVLETPPAGPVRQPAEFEPTSAVIVPGINHGATANWLPYEFLADASEDINLIILHRQERDRTNTEDLFALHGVNPDHCVFYETDGMTGGARDVAPWCIFDGQGEAAFALLRPVAPPGRNPVIGEPMYGLDQGYPVHRTGLKIDGGNFMTDGQGIGVSTDSVYGPARSGDIASEVPGRLRDYLGVHTYHVIPDALKSDPNGWMGHVDCFAKFLSPDTIMVLEYPPTRASHQDLEKIAAYFRRQVSCYGTPYRVVRVFSGQPAAYANSLIVNRKIYVPINGTEWDEGALAAYRTAMPGYQVVALTWTWVHLDALHCRTMGIPDEDMLYIEHIPVLDRPSGAKGFPIRAKIIAHSQKEFVKGTPAVLWRTPADANDPQEDPNTPGPWTTVPMTGQPELRDHQYLAHIPAQPVGRVIQYYLQAQDASGRNETHPYIGEAQAHTFTVNTLGASCSAISARRGGTIEIYMNAGQSYAQKKYRLRCSLCADVACGPGSGRKDVIEVDVSGGENAVLPKTTVFTGFNGTLDESGIGSARLVLSNPLAPDRVGGALRFSLELDTPQKTVAGTVCVQILD